MGKISILFHHSRPYRGSDGCRNRWVLRCPGCPNQGTKTHFVLGMPMEQPPGEVFEYNGGATQLLASIIERASGQGIAAFAEKNLFEPLGIEVFEWNRYPPSQIAAAPSGLRLRSKDMMKFGLLYQNHGIWEGQQLLPAQWVEETFKAHVEKPGQPGAYLGINFMCCRSSHCQANGIS